MKIDVNTITKLSTLSKIELSEEEKIEFSSQLSNITEYVDKLNKLDTGNVEPTDQVLDQKNIFREDIVKPSMSVEQIAEMATAFEDDMFVVPQIIE